MAVLLTDNFNRANSTTSPGSPQTGGPYTAEVGTWGISNNALYTSVSTASSLLTFPAAVDIDISIRLTTLGGSPGIVFRYVDASNYWMFVATAGPNWSLQRRIAGTVTGMWNNITGATAGDTARVLAVGNVIRPYVNGRLLGQYEDDWASVATARAGFYLNSSTAARIDDASASDATGHPLSGSPAYVYKGRSAAALDTIGVA